MGLSIHTASLNTLVLNHATIGNDTIIGASSLVPERKHIPSGMLALGVPAKVIRELNEAERADLIGNAERYKEFFYFDLLRRKL